MINKNWKTEICTIPNLFSFFRLLLIPLYMHIYLNAQTQRQYYIAGIILAISCLTDAIDGKIARDFHMISTVGKVLDPLADKITQFALILSLVLKYSALKPVLMLFAVKELFQVIMGVFYLHQGKMLTGALPEGKLCTAVLFVSLIVLVFFPELNPNMIKFISWVDGTFLSISLFSYFLAYWGNSTKIQDIKTE